MFGHKWEEFCSHISGIWSSMALGAALGIILDSGVGLHQSQGAGGGISPMRRASQR